MILTNKSNSLRFTGRWELCEDGKSITTAPGAMVECAFVGKEAILNFDIEFSKHPFPHIYISLDNGAKIESPVDALLRIEPETYGEHYIKIIYKSSVEEQHRWYHPLEAKVALKGIEVNAEGVLPVDNRKVIEFIGDSITEGVLIDDWRQPISGLDTYNRPYQDDSTATYAYLTAEKLNLKPIVMGYGAVGITKGGCGSVPRVFDAYPYNFSNSPAVPANADITVINHGANDRFKALSEYISEYYDFLKLVRKRNPDTIIVVLGAFCGFAADELREMVEKFNCQERDNVVYICTNGWVPLEPLHPRRDGHKVIANYLAAELKKIL